MIPGTSAIRQSPSWQHELARAIVDPAELISILHLDTALIEPARKAVRSFGLRVPRGYVARMRPGDPNDPLLLQVMPRAEEFLAVPGFIRDPVGDLSAMVSPGVLQKYHGRLLLTTTGACAIHCRYCFRRHFPYTEANAAADDWQDALSAIQADRSIREVILSGGDPLTLSDVRLASFVRSLATIQHVERLRIHTRLPIVLPERVTAELCDLLTSSRLHCVIVVHANHPNEIDEQVAGSLKRLRNAGATMLNQSVLLKGVNDNAEILCALSESLFSAGTLPYYLHLLDKVEGTAHFDSQENIALQLWSKMAASLPGYLVPRLVREEPGSPNKTFVR